MKNSELRPCFVQGVEGKEVKHLFHCWSQVSEIVPPSNLVGGHNGGVVAETFAIVEAKDGRIIRVRPEKIRFDHREEVEE